LHTGRFLPPFTPQFCVDGDCNGCCTPLLQAGVVRRLLVLGEEDRAAGAVAVSKGAPLVATAVFVRVPRRALTPRQSSPKRQQRTAK
jgi:hypothetical protein